INGLSLIRICEIKKQKKIMKTISSHHLIIVINKINEVIETAINIALRMSTLPTLFSSSGSQLRKKGIVITTKEERPNNERQLKVSTRSPPIIGPIPNPTAIIVVKTPNMRPCSLGKK